MAKSAATPVLCMLGLAVAIAFMAAGANGANCNTNGGSPTQASAKDMVAHVQSLGNDPCCTSICLLRPFRCKELYRKSGGRVLICGPCNKCTSCATVASALNNLVNQCTRSVGGAKRVAGDETAAGLTFVIDINR